jgi:hypothetical protein
VPRPKTAKTFGVFAHEVGHQLKHRTGRSRLRDYEVEIEAWRYALDQFDRFSLPGASVVAKDAARSLDHVFAKGLRRTPAARLAERVEQMMGAAPDWWRDGAREQLLRNLAAAIVERKTAYRPTAWRDYEHGTESWTLITASGTSRYISGVPPAQYTRCARRTVRRSDEPLTGTLDEEGLLEPDWLPCAGCGSTRAYVDGVMVERRMLDRRVCADCGHVDAVR